MALGSPKSRERRRRKPGKLDRRLGSEAVAAERRDVSATQESRTADRFKGQVQRASGATERHKGDVKTDRLLIENKTRLPSAKDGAKSIRIQGSWLEKINREAMAAGRDPVLSFEIPGIEDPACPKQWVALPEHTLAALLEELEGLAGG